jgi:hypothetical protein
MERNLEHSGITEQANIENHNDDEVSSMFDIENLHSRIIAALAGTKGEDRRIFLFKQLQKATVYFHGKENQFKELLQNLRTINFSSDQELITQVSESIHDFAVTNFSPEELTKNIENREQEEVFENLNDMLSYGGNSNIIHIHIVPKPEALEGKKPKEKIEYLINQVKDGLHKLAGLMQTDPRWENVKKVTAASWLVARHTEKMEELGFVIEGPISDEFRKKYFKNDPRPISSAYIDRLDFLRKYGN